MSLRFTFFWFAVIGWLSAGCERTPGIFAKPSEEIIGTWRYQKVEYRPEGQLYYMGQTARFKYDRISFNQNRTLSIVDTRTGNVQQGKWRIDRSYGNTATNEQTIDYLIMEIEERGDTITYVWEITFISYQKLSATEYLEDETWRYVLKSGN